MPARPSPAIAPTPHTHNNRRPNHSPFQPNPKCHTRAAIRSHSWRATQRQQQRNGSHFRSALSLKPQTANSSHTRGYTSPHIPHNAGQDGRGKRVHGGPPEDDPPRVTRVETAAHAGHNTAATAHTQASTQPRHAFQQSCASLSLPKQGGDPAHVAATSAGVWTSFS